MRTQIVYLGEKKICLLQLQETMRNESFPREIKGNNCIFDILNSFPASSFTRGINQPWELVAAGLPFPAY